MTQDKNRQNDQTLRLLERHVAEHPGSPAYLRLAALLLEMQRPEEALKRCLLGIKRTPDHPTALLLMARAQVMLRHYNDARESLRVLLSAVPGGIAARQLLEKIPELELAYPPAVASAIDAFSLPRREVQAETRWSRQENILPTLPRVGPASQTPAPDEGPTVAVPVLDLSALAARLEHARIPALANDLEEDIAADEDDIETVNLQLRPQTETLARIYSSQGRYREAIDAFRSLSGLHPDRAAEFEQHIRELERKLAES
ncbi:MAG: tetratricopeptide repeat protein [Bacteroidia bacterium]|nr:tetratricopeptide repeat protein [Bacteroidia bacterium]